MNLIRTALALTIAMLALSQPAVMIASSTKQSRSALEQRQQEFAAAMAVRDAARVAAFFSENGLLHVANQPPIEGRAGIERFYTQVFRFLAGTDMEADKIQISSSEDLAFVTARVTNAFERDGQRIEFQGKCLLVWEQVADVWVLAVYALSNNRSDAGR
jgi:uncharacterized protein (TIGR02246 family)